MPGALLGSSPRLKLSPHQVFSHHIRSALAAARSTNQHPQAWAPARKGKGWNPGEGLPGTDREKLRSKLRVPTRHCPLWTLAS